VKLRTLPCLVVLLLAVVGFEARAHHPVGIPQYRQTDAGIVLIYNVMTQDHVVRFQALPGRPSAPPATTVEISAEIAPKEPAVAFPGGTWLSISEDLGGGAERELLPAERKSDASGPRTVRASFPFERPGSYVVRVEFLESPGREVLVFPLLVTRSGSGSGPAAKVLLPAAGALLLLLLARLAAARRRSGRPAPEPGRG